MAIVDVKVPDIGDFKDVAVIELLVKPGDAIQAEQSLITVESDKASMEIPSSHAGVVRELKGALGDKVSEGSVVLTLEVGGAAVGEGAVARRPDPEGLPTLTEAISPPLLVPVPAPPPAAGAAVAGRGARRGGDSATPRDRRRCGRRTPATGRTAE